MIYYGFISGYEQQSVSKKGMSQELFIAGLVIENSPLPLWQTVHKTEHLDSPGESYCTSLPFAYFRKGGKPHNLNGAPAYTPKQDYIIVGI